MYPANKEQIKGIYVKSNKTFYYLETGNISSYHSIDRLRGMLISRGLITYHRTDINNRSESYQILSLQEAEDLNMTVEVIYLNKHIEKIAKSKTTNPNNPWE